jgi:hypothetical protein
MNLTANNTILACENQDPTALVESVDSLLTEKLIGAIDKKQKSISATFIIEAKKEIKDPYETYDPVVKEAIDYVVETVLESGLELENTIQLASKQYKVNDKDLKEYFDTFLETTKTEVKVDSTSSDDEDNKRGMRDDEDTNKRVRYESRTVILGDGNQMVLSEGFWEQNIDPVLENLNEDNRKSFLNILTKNKVNFLKAVNFCQTVVKG